MLVPFAEEMGPQQNRDMHGAEPCKVPMQKRRAQITEEWKASKIEFLMLDSCGCPVDGNCPSIYDALPQ